MIISDNSPLKVLLPYQVDWVGDDSRFKIGMWARQTGKSFSTAAEAVTDCRTRKTMWVTMSAGERQALEWMQKARDWSAAYEFAIEDYAEDRDSAEALLKSAEIRFPNGSRLVAIPALPATARGYSANVVLDEFAHHERPDEIWKAVYPSISNPLKGELKLRVVSTPNGQGNKFHDLWSKPNKYSKHLIDIYTAVKRGLPVDIEELKEGLDDPEAWAQEYECQFIDSAAVLLDYALIALMESAECSETQSPDWWMGHRAHPIVLGIDFARKRHLTVCWVAEVIGPLMVTREVLCIHDTSTPEQMEILRHRIKAADKVAFDYTGPGIGMGDYLVKEFGQWEPTKDKWGKVELCTFSNTLKAEIFSKLKIDAEKREVLIPSSRTIREDLHSIHRVVSTSGNIVYRAPMNEDGHADRCTALALANRARRQMTGRIVPPMILSRNSERAELKRRRMV